MFNPILPEKRGYRISGSWRLSTRAPPRENLWICRRWKKWMLFGVRYRRIELGNLRAPVRFRSMCLGKSDRANFNYSHTHFPGTGFAYNLLTWLLWIINPVKW